MPNFSATRAALAIEGGGATFVPPRFSGVAARVRLVSGRANFSILGVPVAPNITRLRRFEENRGGVSNNRGTATIPVMGQTTVREQIVQQRNAEGIESAFKSLQSQVAALEQVFNLTREAQRTANDVAERVAIEKSYTDPPSVVTASSAGVVSIAAHSRVYTDAARTTVTVNAGSVSAFAPGDVVTVFYNDAARAGGTVAYQTSMMAVAQEGSVHVVGRVQIPQAGEPPASGGGPTAPGYVPPPDGVPEPGGFEVLQ